MRFVVGPIPQDNDFDPEVAGWTPLREPGPWLAQLFSFPIALATAVVLILAVLAVAGSGWSPGDTGIAILLALPVMIALIPLHEYCHLAVHPKFGRSTDSVIGFWPSRLIFFAHYEGELSRGRFRLILLGPFIALTLFPLFVGVAYSDLSPLFAALIVTNGVLSGADLLGAGMIAVQVPRDAIVRNQGYRTCWRFPAQQAHPADSALESVD